MEANKMETPEMITLEAYRNSMREYNKLKDKAEEFTKKICKIFYNLPFSLKSLELEDDDNIRVSGFVTFVDEDFITFVFPIKWFILSDDELDSAINKWIEERKKKAEK